MEKPSILFTGIFGAFAISVGAMVLIPHSQLASMQPQVTWDEGQNAPSDVYPVKRTMGGRDVYVAEGCFYCHSQQVRDPQYGPDMERGWGSRRTVARDYVHEDAPLLGSVRLGPDFANYGWTTKVAQKDGTEKTRRAQRAVDLQAPVQSARDFLRLEVPAVSVPFREKGNRREALAERRRTRRKI
jgi:cbb3-type cytochrome oxidase cytochrome c subunit